LRWTVAAKRFIAGPDIAGAWYVFAFAQSWMVAPVPSILECVACRRISAAKLFSARAGIARTRDFAAFVQS